MRSAAPGLFPSPATPPDLLPADAPGSPFPSAPERAEVVIVGAGPAGAVTALLLARAGRDVLLLDRRAFPRPKPCGDCLSPGAGPLLRRLGLLDRLLAARPARIAGWRLHAPDGTAFEARFAASARDPDAAYGLALPREALDCLLLDAAIEAGARVRTAATVTDLLRRDGRVNGVRARADGEELDLEARVVVGADGLRSIVARRLGLAAPPGPVRKLSFTSHVVGVEGVGSLGEMHLAEHACLGLAPVASAGRRTTCNMTLVVDAAHHAAAIRQDAAAFQARMLLCFPALSGRLSEMAPAGSAGEPLASGPFDRPVRPAAVPGAVLVGDAAGYFDPFTGQGIHQALEGAALLAGALVQGLAGDDASLDSALRRFRRRRAGRMRASRLLQRGIERVVSRPASAAWWFGRLARAPAAAERLLAVTGGIVHPIRLLTPAAVRDFLVTEEAVEAVTC